MRRYALEAILVTWDGQGVGMICSAHDAFGPVELLVPLAKTGVLRIQGARPQGGLLGVDEDASAAPIT